VTSVTDLNGSIFHLSSPVKSLLSVIGREQNVGSVRGYEIGAEFWKSRLTGRWLTHNHNDKLTVQMHTRGPSQFYFHLVKNEQVVGEFDASEGAATEVVKSRQDFH
jgi:hypothetical protein